MKVLWSIALLVLLAACSRPLLSFEQVSKAKEYCTSHKLDSVIHYVSYRADDTRMVYEVLCRDTQGMTYTVPKEITN